MKKRYGIDVSTWQKNLDYKALKNANVDFALIKIAQDTYTDAMFKTHYADCAKNGMSVGVYYYANNRDHALSANEDAGYVSAALKGYYLCILTWNGREMPRV